MELTKDKKVVGYSPSEKKVFAALPKNGDPLNTVEITKKVYGRSTGKRPYNARQVILGALVRLREKVRTNGEAFSIERSEREGPHPVKFWIEK